MAFANAFNGDTVSLNYILQTLDRKSIIIPGITANPNLTVSAAGEVAYFYERGSSNIGTGSVGAQLTYVSTGGTKVSITLDKAIQIKDVLPLVNSATVSADIIGDRAIYNSILAANKQNELAVAYLISSATAFDTSNSAAASYIASSGTAYQIITEAQKVFKVLNKATAMKPTAVIVSSGTYALLLNSKEFIRSTLSGDDVVYEGVVGKIAGLNVVEAVDLTVDFIILNAEGFAAPTNINSFVLADGTAAGYPNGTIIAGELGYGFYVKTGLIYSYSGTLT